MKLSPVQEAGWQNAGFVQAVRNGMKRYGFKSKNLL